MSNNKKLFSNKKALSFLIFVFCILYFVFFPSCSNSTSSNNTLTLSGTVTLEDTTDYSGVKVMVFEPVEIDTVLTNELQKHTDVGIELNQRTEFFWREHTPVYSTTTNSYGEWEIKNVEAGVYHLVIQAPGYGWRVLFNVGVKKHDITLKKVILLNGAYSSDMNITANSFVQVVGNTIFETGTHVTIGEGTILEFLNNSTLEFRGQVNILGVLGNEVYIVPKDTTNSSRIRLNESDYSVLDYACFMYLNNGIYITSVDSLQIKYSRFRKQLYAMEFFNCTKLHVENNIISGMRDGVVSQETQLYLRRNIIVDNSQNGLKSSSAKNSLIEYNIFKQNAINGIGINWRGYEYTETFLQIYYNDFLNNKNHIYVGNGGDCDATNNNFLYGSEYNVFTSPNPELYTLNFQLNYWGTFDENMIQNKIYDRLDRLGQNHEGPTVDYSQYKQARIKW